MKGSEFHQRIPNTAPWRLHVLFGAVPGPVRSDRVIAMQKRWSRASLVTAAATVQLMVHLFLPGVGSEHEACMGMDCAYEHYMKPY